MSDSVESPLSPHQDTPPPPQLPPSYQVPDADPGLVIVFKAAPDVHNCMGLPSVANLTPPLQQGANADQSVAALTQWLDGQAAAFGIGHCLLFDVSGRRVPGLYHRMTTGEESRFRSFLGAKLTQWGAEASVNGMSCGWLVEVAGAGVGKLLMTVHHLGPFHG